MFRVHSDHTITRSSENYLTVFIGINAEDFQESIKFLISAEIRVR